MTVSSLTATFPFSTPDLLSLCPYRATRAARRTPGALRDRRAGGVLATRTSVQESVSPRETPHRNAGATPRCPRLCRPHEGTGGLAPAGRDSRLPRVGGKVRFDAPAPTTLELPALGRARAALAGGLGLTRG